MSQLLLNNESIHHGLSPQAPNRQDARLATPRLWCLHPGTRRAQVPLPGPRGDRSDTAACSRHESPRTNTLDITGANSRALTGEDKASFALTMSDLADVNFHRKRVSLHNPFLSQFLSSWCFKSREERKLRFLII